MKTLKVLNLYACLGGNRYKWDEVAEAANIDLRVTAVELDPELCRLYQERFPNDIVILADAHQYLLDHYTEYDFIWASPPCPSHSRARFWSSSNEDTTIKPVYPDMKLYQEIILLQNYYKGLYCVENVIPFYEPLIPAQKRGRHLYWCNFKLSFILSNRKSNAISNRNEVARLSKFHDYDFCQYKGEQRIQKIARNLVDYEAGKKILATALGVKLKKDQRQQQLF